MKLNLVDTKVCKGVVRQNYELEYSRIKSLYKVDAMTYNLNEMDYVITKSCDLKYLPNIYYSCLKEEFEVSTTSYGCLNSFEIKELVVNLKIANDVVQYLNKIFLNK